LAQFSVNKNWYVSAKFMQTSIDSGGKS